MSIRQRPANRRASTNFAFECDGLKYGCTVSFADLDNRPIELFLSNHKQGSAADSNARDAAILASLALQFGAPLLVLQRAVLRNADGSASTPVGCALDIVSSWGSP